MFDRLFRHSGLFEMRGNLPVPAFDVGRIHLGQRPRHAPVQIALAHQAQFRAGHFAQAVVREIVLRSPAAFDDAPPPEFIERLGNAGFVPIRSLLEQFEGEGPPHHARQAGQFVRSRRELRQARCDYGMHPRALQSGAHTLHHKQRIAASGPEDLSQVPAFERFRGFQARQFGRLLGIQRLQRNFQNHPRLPQPRQKPGERMFAARLFRPHRPEHQNAGRGGRGQQSVEPLERVGIAPLHVVQIQQQRLPALSESGAQRFVEMQPLPAFGERTGLSGPGQFEFRKLLADFRHQPRQFRQLLWPEARPARANRVGTQPLRHGRVGHLPLSGVTAAARGRMPLADARLI